MCDGGEVTDFAHDVKACALGQASSSIMARHVVGAKPAELRELRETVRKMLKENGPPPAGKWADIAVLEPVRDYKARHASTLLTFDAVVSALDQIEAKQAKQARAGRRIAISPPPGRRSSTRASSARSPSGLLQLAESRGRFCEAPVLPSRMPVTRCGLSVLISIEWLPMAANAPISVAGTRPEA